MSDDTVQSVEPIIQEPGELYGVIGEFDTPEGLLQAARAARREGYTKVDAMTPFPIHGLEDAVGLKASPLGFIVMGVGLCGTAAALLLQWWTGAVDYPLVIGGKPLFALEFSIPVTFELTVLFAAFAAVLGMFALNGLPRFHHPSFHYKNFPAVTDDRFLLVIERTDPLFDAEIARRHLLAYGAVNTELVEA
jgi:hypothetical protein